MDFKDKLFIECTYRRNGILINLDHVSYEHDGKKIINDVTLHIAEGDFITIIGSSGSGKSTLIRLIADLISPTEGNITFKGEDYHSFEPTKLRRKITMCFQTPSLFGETVWENMTFPFMIRDVSVDREKIESYFELFQMPKEYLEKDVYSLSGGEKQRIALIRSLLFDPEVLLLDEVTSALDEENTAIVEKVICERNEAGTTVLWITHNIEQSEKMGSRRIQIEAGEIVKEEVMA